MAIPRLPPAPAPISISLTVSANLRPYFTEFYQDRKQAGESPEQFLLRYMKEAVREYWVGSYENQIIEATRAEQRAVFNDSAGAAFRLAAPDRRFLLLHIFPL